VVPVEWPQYCFSKRNSAWVAELSARKARSRKGRAFLLVPAVPILDNPPELRNIKSTAARVYQAVFFQLHFSAKFPLPVVISAQMQ
jgi:hypothetical protein